MVNTILSHYCKIYAVCLLTILCSLSCQDPQAHLWSAWGVADTVLTARLDVDSTYAERDFSRYMNEEVNRQLIRLQKLDPNLRSVGLLSLNQDLQGKWNGFFAYEIQGWPLLLKFVLSRKDGRSDRPFMIEHLPFFKAYLSLAELIQSSPNQQSSSQLSKVRQGATWHGGLIGRDTRGRALSSVVVVWLPPLAFVDGLPLSGVADRTQFSNRLAKAFAQRQLLAEQAQASYTPHVSLALPAQAPASQLVELMAWSEGVGAEQVSLIAQSEQEPVLLYLSHRTNRATLMSPQRLIHAHLSPEQGKLLIQRTDHSKLEQTRGTLQLHNTINEQENKTQQSLESYSLIMDRALQKDRLNGVIIHIDEKVSVGEVIHYIDLTQAIDDELPITFAPLTPENSESKAKEK